MCKERKCKECRWFEKENNQYICGYVAEVYHIAKLVDVDFICTMNKFQALTTNKSQNIEKIKEGEENDHSSSDHIDNLCNTFCNIIHHKNEII